MSTTEVDQEDLAEVKEFLEARFGLVIPEPEPGMDLEAHTTLTGRNQPEFYADAPWRLEPDLDELPLLFVIRDANVQDPGLGPWRLDELSLEERLTSGEWRTLRCYRPGELPGVAGDGSIAHGYWSYATHLPLQTLQAGAGAQRGQTVRLRVEFAGRFPPYDAPAKPARRYLQIYLAEEPLPLGRAESAGSPRRWFYGDTHYHSSYTNDIWEFGNPVQAARYAGRAIGLDWLSITDHSCDLDDQDPEDGGMTRWQRLERDLAKPEISDHSFRMIPGEEITFRSAAGGYVHLLAMGSFKEMVPGGFWSEEDTAIKWFAKLVNRLVSKLGGYPENAIDRVLGPILDFGQVVGRLPSRALLFAAHPYDQAQPPFQKSGWTEQELADPRLTGHEFWNGRLRRQTEFLLDPSDNPFEEPKWNDATTLRKRDEARVEQLKDWVDRWEAMLRQGVDEWAAEDERPSLRPVFVGGSDAHGDFNYAVGVGWNYRQHGYMTDNAVGRVRTLVHVADHDSSAVPARTDLLAALRRGACAVTDGPALELSLGHNGQTGYLGDVMTLNGDGIAELTVRGHSTAEFGEVNQVTVIAYLQGEPERIQREVYAGQPDTIDLKGRQGFLRAYAWTKGRDDEPFCCFTNPIWLRITDGETKQLRIILLKG